MYGGDLEEELPPDMPESRGIGFVMRCRRSNNSEVTNRISGVSEFCIGLMDVKETRFY